MSGVSLHAVGQTSSHQCRPVPALASPLTTLSGFSSEFRQNRRRQLTPRYGDIGSNYSTSLQSLRIPSNLSTSIMQRFHNVDMAAMCPDLRKCLLLNGEQRWAWRRLAWPIRGGVACICWGVSYRWAGTRRAGPTTKSHHVCFSHIMNHTHNHTLAVKLK